MSSKMKKIILLGIIIITGFVTARLGTPYNSLVFGAHKIALVVLVVWIVKSAIESRNEDGKFPFIAKISLIVLLPLVITGGIMALSDNVSMYQWIHRIIGYGIALFVFATIAINNSNLIGE